MNVFGFERLVRSKRVAYVNYQLEKTNEKVFVKSKKQECKINDDKFACLEIIS